MMRMREIDQELARAESLGLTAEAAELKTKKLDRLESYWKNLADVPLQAWFRMLPIDGFSEVGNPCRVSSFSQRFPGINQPRVWQITFDGSRWWTLAELAEMWEWSWDGQGAEWNPCTTAVPTDSPVEAVGYDLDALREEVAELRQKVETAPKSAKKG